MIGTWCGATAFLRYLLINIFEAAMFSKRVFLYSAAMALLGTGLMASARADSAYTNPPVRWVVPYAAGGATDVLSRFICQRLSERLGQPFIVENKPGPGSNIGTPAGMGSPDRTS